VTCWPSLLGRGQFSCLPLRKMDWLHLSRTRGVCCYNNNDVTSMSRWRHCYKNTPFQTSVASPWSEPGDLNKTGNVHKTSCDETKILGESSLQTINFRQLIFVVSPRIVPFQINPWIEEGKSNQFHEHVQLTLAAN